MVYQSKWKAEDKIRIVMESINTSISISELCRKYGVVPNTFYQWKERFLEAGKLGLTTSGHKTKNGGASRELENENERLKKLIGELAIANDALKKALEGGGRRR
jgi:transposase-like protein